MKKNYNEGQKLSENTSIGERISLIRSRFFGGDTAKIAQVLNIHYANVSKIIKGEYQINRQSIENLLIAVPELNPDWLLFGREPMLRDEIVTNITTNNGNVAGVNNGTQTCAEAGVVAKLTDTIATQQRTIEQQNEHIATLLSLLSQKQ